MSAETSDPTAPLPARPLEDPRLLAYLPMLYVAWADGDLAAAEIGAICERAQAELPDEHCAELLGDWLDPANPPSAADLQRLLATAYALHFGLHHLAERYVASDAAGDDGERREVEAMAAGMKAFATWHATETIQTCREACGGQGYLAVNRLAALKADTDVFTTFEGDNTVLLQLAAKSLLTGYRKQFSEMNAVGLVKYVAARAATVLTELNPVVTRLTSEEHLRDRDFHLGAFRWREEHLLSTLARRLKAKIDLGEDPFAALVECQDHAVSLAKANVERLVLERFAAAVEATEDPAVADVLGRLCTLFALWRIERDMAWFLEHGTLEAAKAKAIRKLVNQLLAELRPVAVPLVDAFGIPDELLAAPIAVG